MIRIAATAVAFGLGLALLGATNSAANAADRDTAVRDGAMSERVVVKRRVRRGYHGCPDGYGCYPLYGAYGPYGGRAYWSSFSYLVPSYASGAVLRSRY
jgi:hypothetical protein